MTAKPQIKYAFVGDNGPGTEPEQWAKFLFDSEDSAKRFGGRWMGTIVKVEVRALDGERTHGDRPFVPYEKLSGS